MNALLRNDIEIEIPDVEQVGIYLEFFGSVEKRGKGFIAGKVDL